MGFPWGLGVLLGASGSFMGPWGLWVLMGPQWGPGASMGPPWGPLGLLFGGLLGVFMGSPRGLGLGVLGDVVASGTSMVLGTSVTS